MRELTRPDGGTGVSKARLLGLVSAQQYNHRNWQIESITETSSRVVKIGQESRTLRIIIEKWRLLAP